MIGKEVGVGWFDLFLLVFHLINILPFFFYERCFGWPRREGWPSPFPVEKEGPELFPIPIQLQTRNITTPFSGASLTTPTMSREAKMPLLDILNLNLNNCGRTG